MAALSMLKPGSGLDRSGHSAQTGSHLLEADLGLGNLTPVPTGGRDGAQRWSWISSTRHCIEATGRRDNTGFFLVYFLPTIILWIVCIRLEFPHAFQKAGNCTVSIFSSFHTIGRL